MTLFETPVTVRPRELLACCQRELAYRRRVYPRLIAKGSMTERKAVLELELMQACVDHFRALAAGTA